MAVNSADATEQPVITRMILSSCFKHCESSAGSSGEYRLVILSDNSQHEIAVQTVHCMYIAQKNQHHLTLKEEYQMLQNNYDNL